MRKRQYTYHDIFQYEQRALITAFCDFMKGKKTLEELDDVLSMVINDELDHP